MKKNVLCLTLVFALVFSALLPTVVSYAVAVDEGALNLLLEKLASMDEGKRKDGAVILNEYLRDGDKGIDDLKKDLESIATDSQKETLKSYGYTIEDVKRELDILYSFSQSDRILLIDHIKAGDTQGIKSLVKNYDSDSSGSTGGTPSVGGGGGSPAVPPTNSENIEKLLEVKFKDISNHPLKDDIVFLAERGIIEGKTCEKFDPNGDLTRAEFVTLMSRVLKLKPKDEKALPFKDVKSGSWYYETVKIAYDYEIVNGTSTTTFSPNKELTREEMIVIAMRILSEKKLVYGLESTGKDLEMYTDKEEISPWAVTHMFQGVKCGIAIGRTETTMNPKDFATRAEAAQLIRKLYDILNKQDVVEVMNK